MTDALQQGIAALKSGDRAAARRHLTAAVQAEPDNVQAWLWLSGALESSTDRERCLQRVLKLDPHNAAAQRGLAAIQGAPSAKAAPPQPAPVQPPPAPPSTARPRGPLASRQPPAATPPPDSDDPWASLRQADFIAAEEAPSSPPPPPPIYTPPPPVAPPPPPPAEEKPTGQLPPASEIRKMLVKEEEDAPQEKRPAWMIGCIIVLAGLIVCVLATALVLLLNRGNGSSGSWMNLNPALIFQPASSATPAPPHATRTPYATPVEVTQTPRPTRTPTPTPTFVVLGPTVVSQMEKIQKQVSDLRGLDIRGEVQSYIEGADTLEGLLRNEVDTEETRQDLNRQVAVYSALGLVKPTYDLVNSVINHLVDSIGGYFEPNTKNIFIIGIEFNGMHHWVYSHEYGHALVDMHYNFMDIKSNEICANDQQHCDAVTALIEGDATLVSYQWLEQYASPQDYRDLISYRPPVQALPEEFPPPYVVEDIRFPYDYGYYFVSDAFERGNWSAVNRIYEKPPTTTEQILHPEKYYSGEGAIAVDAPDLLPALGDRWEQIENNVLGEWTTYLLLGFGADYSAQLGYDQADVASAGWGGDRYQVYREIESGQTALAAHWVWDTVKDAQEFNKALAEHLDPRFRGGKIPEKDNCWSASGQTTCMYTAGARTLWLMAPEMEQIELMKLSYPQFP